MSSPDGLARLLESTGWVAPSNPEVLESIRGAIDVSREIEALLSLTSELDHTGDDDERTRIVAQIVAHATSLISIVAERASHPPVSGQQAPFDQADFWEDFLPQMATQLVCGYLKRSCPLVYAILAALGIVEVTWNVPTDEHRRAFYGTAIRWDRLPHLFDPVASMRDIYSWGASGAALEHEHLLRAIASICGSIGLRCLIGRPEAAFAEQYWNASPNAEVKQLDVYLFSIDDPNDEIRFAFTLRLRILPIPDDFGDPRVVGLAISPAIDGEIGADIFDLGISIVGGAANASLATLALRPHSITLDSAAVVETETLAVSIDPVKLIAGRALPLRFGLFGVVDLNLHEVSLTISVSSARGEPELSIGARINRLEFGIDPAQMDGFLRRVFAGSAPSAAVALGVTWSSRSGFHLDGAGAFELRVSVPFELGPIRFDAVSIEAGFDAAGISCACSISGGIQIGPVAASIDRIGVRARLASVASTVPSPRFEVRPPTGIGLAIDAGPVSGGGFLSFDPDHGRYSGALQLDILSVAIRAIGLLQTPLPGQDDGYSLLVILTAEFPSIPIGMGFTLNGVGGLAGIHRGLNPRALSDGVRNGTARNILFPEDPVRNAATLLANLEQIFPTEEGHYVFGPMVKIGYGSPNFVTAEIGILLEVPDPVRIVLIGKIRAFYPRPERATVIINLDVVGILDFGAKLFALDATIYDSRIAAFNISGDMAMRLSWGDQPTFALSLGGLHPHFPPPPDFPTLRRICISLGSINNPRIQLQAYLALTSNSLQLGASAEIGYHSGSFEISGMIGFDTLVIFSPFSFSIAFTAAVTLRLGSVSLLSASIDATIEGPRPWHFFGHAAVSALFLEAHVPFDVRFGQEATPDTIPAVDAETPLLEAIGTASNWRSELPAGRVQSISFKAPANDTDTPRLDPSGNLTFRQRVAPLGKTLERFNQAPIEGANRFDVESIAVGDTTYHSGDWTEVTDHFAPGQFEELTGDEKLSRPSFELMTAGVTLNAGRPQYGTARSLDDDKSGFNEITIGADESVSVRNTASLAAVRSQLRRGAAANGALRAAGNARFAPPPSQRSLVAFDSPRYVVGSVDTARDLGITLPASQGDAQEALDAYLIRNPQRRGQLQVMPLHEAA